MRQKLYGNHITPACATCRRATASLDNETVLCPRKGIVPAHEHCRKYIYDPLKRVPYRAPKGTVHFAREFSLEEISE